MKDKAKPTHSRGGTDKRTSAAERKADEVLREALDKYHEATASVHELLRRRDEAYTHLAACQKAYRRVKGLPEEMKGGDTDILMELFAEIRVQHDAEEADKAKPTRTKGGTDKRRSAAERKADEVLSEALHNYREAVASADKLGRRVSEAFAHRDACNRAYLRASGFDPENMLDETDLMAELIAEVDAQREAEEAERKKAEKEKEKE